MKGAATVLGMLAVALAALVVAPAASAYDEADASLLRPDVAAVWHSPDPVQPHTQWQGFLRLRPGSNVTDAAYQICQVGRECFAPPHAATRVDGLTFRVDTAEYLANGAPVRYEAGWRIGVKWILTGNAGMPEAFPVGTPDQDPLCTASPAACAESHYLAFDMPPAKQAPSVSFAIPAIVLAAAMILRRGDASA